MLSTDAQLRDEVEQDFATELDRLLADAGRLEDPAEVEHLVGVALAAFRGPSLPPPLAELVVSVFERGADPDRAGLLAAVEMLSTGPLVDAARAALERLRARGVEPALPPGVGTLELERAEHVVHEGEELLLARLRRPGRPGGQLAFVGLVHEDEGPTLVEGLLTPPLSDAELADTLAGVPRPADVPAVPLGQDALAARLAEAASRSAAAGETISAELSGCLAVLGRAVGAPPAAWAELEAGLPAHPLDVDQDDDEGFAEVQQTLLEQLAEWAAGSCPPGGAVYRHGDFIAGTLLDFKWGHADGRLGHWTEEDVETYLLEHLPRKVSGSEETFVDAPDCVIAFVRFLDAQGLLAGDPPDMLVDRCEQLRASSLAATRDRSLWGPAKTVVMAALAEGVDPSEPAAMEAFLLRFNARAAADRQRLVDGAAGRSGGKRTAAGRNSTGAKRKATRSARRRNRR
jgi:hypothetical protein